MTREIVVCDYDPSWPSWFEKVSDSLWPFIADIAIRIDHVGSTAVPGLAAKPIIDLDIVVASPDDLGPVIEQLALIGCRWRGDLGVVGREAFEPLPLQDMPAHHLYLVVENNRAHVDHWLLRDVLREDPRALERYAALKRRNAKLAKGEIDFYVAAKAGFVAELLTGRARREGCRPRRTGTRGKAVPDPTGQRWFRYGPGLCARRPSRGPPQEIRDHRVEALVQWGEHLGGERIGLPGGDHQLRKDVDGMTERGHLELHGDQAQLFYGSRPADVAVADERHRLAVELREHVVHRVLERCRVAVVVLAGDDDETVGALDCPAKAGHVLAGVVTLRAGRRDRRDRRKAADDPSGPRSRVRGPRGARGDPPTTQPVCPRSGPAACYRLSPGRVASVGAY